jgi:hypothetical protein
MPGFLLPEYHASQTFKLFDLGQIDSAADLA